ncbi:MAG: bifunctional 4-hydroxy-2-oxoglutarate aldolase/2-dehydro-3-deoxy-phosphogluconate aldolase [Candidatus Gastranaerophilales bacterium]|nr:bifunctional 4-hydroxy-2-oxoglutarate aldolase/2-dehydro-3-deoxy-phosphogluconate aldolase [Candidatus Gastranaerophilales bacterium]
MFENIYSKIVEKKLVGVVRESDYQRALDIANAFIEGGIEVIEVTLENQNSLMVIEELSKKADILVGAGSIITTSQAESAMLAGAKYLTSPVLEMNLVRLSKSYKVPVITSASTTNEAYQAWSSGVKVIKLFPASDMGGADYVRDVLKAMPFLQLIPTSGVSPDDFKDYLEAGAVAVGIGRIFYKDLTYDKIVSKVRRAKESLNN